MKALLICGSPNEKGCTFTALSEVEKTLNKKMETFPKVLAFFILLVYNVNGNISKYLHNADIHTLS